MIDHYFYLYGIVAKTRTVTFDVILEGGLAALIERVSTTEFAPEVLEERLKSLEWVGPQARKHDNVLLAATLGGPVIPARLCTLFSNEEAVRCYLAENQDRLLATLDRLTGCEEWALKVYCDEDLLLEKLLARLPEPTTVSGPGLAYVLGKRRRAEAEMAKTKYLEDVADQMLTALAEVTRDLREIALLPAETDKCCVMVLNVCALVEVAARGDFEERANTLASQFTVDGFELVTSGPWPPYSFTNVDDIE